MKHHSFADWDFEDVGWSLDEDIYHDAPPSLVGTAHPVALIKNATTGALSNGRLIVWVRTNNVVSQGSFWFRNQAVDGGADEEDGYRILLLENSILFYYALGGGDTLIDTKAHTWGYLADTWYKIRLTWWTSVDRIYVRVERWTGTEWITLGDEADTDFEDTNDRWKDAAVNRCGFSLTTSNYRDDVEVWG